MNTDVAPIATYAELPAIVKVTAAGAIGQVGPQGPVGPAGPTAPPSLLRPQDCSFIAWTVNPQRYTSYAAFGLSAVGKLLLFAFISGVGGAVTWIRCSTLAGAGLANCYSGIYDANGNLLRSSSDQSANWQASNSSVATLSSSVTLTPYTMYRVGMLVGAATTFPQFTGSIVNTPGAVNMGIPASKSTSAIYGSGLTALPASHGAISPNSGGVALVIS
jgi:hypothetical protein